MSASISEVAEKARVSISTVSRVVNGSAMVNPRTRARVEAAIRELGYRPNALARGLMLRKSEIIGLVLPDLHGEFYSEIIRGANHQARELGYNLLLFSVPQSEDGQFDWPSLRQHALLDGVVVMVAELESSVQELLRSLNLPFVLLDDDFPADPHDSVIIDHRAGTRKLVEHLARDRGIRRMIFVGGLKTNVDTLQRFEVCREVMASVGRPVAERDVHFLDYEFDTAYHFARENLSDWIGPSTCVFAANDEMAAGIATCALEMGITIPGDLAVVGFDDTRIARMTRPALTTVRVPMAEMGARAVELLCRRLANRNAAPMQVKLEPDLVVRDSCRVPPQ